MKFEPYPWQKAAVDHAVTALKDGRRVLYAAPTGCGKSVVELLVQAALPNCWIVSPREEIIAGMLDKLGRPDADMWDCSISTPVRLRNALLRGDLQHPSYLVVDEGHHESAETYQQLALLTGLAPSAAYTATPYRGTPRSTKEFLDRWGEPVQLITLQEAAQLGYVSVPSFETLPLVDDDVVTVRGGEFEVESLEHATFSRLGDMAERCREWHSGPLWDRPTCFSLPSSLACEALRRELLSRGLPAVTVSAATPRPERRAAFEATVARMVALLQINIVSEGVDLPLRRLVDLAPTLSPVKWVQQLGRITRPTDVPPEYVCTNRNLMRHAYALEGAVPVGSLVDSQRAFPETERAHSRALGLEALGRFKPESVKLLSGLRLHVYALSCPVGSVQVEYCCLVHPAMEPVWASKVNTVKDGARQYGRWAKCDAPDDVRGFASRAERAPTPKQQAWWERSAHKYGLDSSAEVTRKNFSALPVLADIGMRFV